MARRIVVIVAGVLLNIKTKQQTMDFYNNKEGRAYSFTCHSCGKVVEYVGTGNFFDAFHYGWEDEWGDCGQWNCKDCFVTVVEREDVTICLKCIVGASHKKVIMRSHHEAEMKAQAYYYEVLLIHRERMALPSVAAMGNGNSYIEFYYESTRNGMRQSWAHASKRDFVVTGLMSPNPTVVIALSEK